MNQTQSNQDVNANSRGSLLKEMEVDSDSELPEFSLPPKSIVKRPRKSIKKRARSRWRKLCRNFCSHCKGFVLVIVLSACILSIALLFWFALRLYRDVENLSRRLAIEINRVQAEQFETIEKCNALKKSMEGNLNLQKFHVWQKDVITLKRNLQTSFSKIDVLNGSLRKISHQLHNAYSKVTLKTKVDALQKGMADTGAEITKLSDDMEQIEKQTSSQSSAIKRINSGLWNISNELANLTGKTETSFIPFMNPLDHFDDDEENLKHKNLEKSSFLFSKEKSDEEETLNSVNRSLLSQVMELQAETEALKMKLVDEHGLKPPSSEGDLYQVIGRVQRDVSLIQQLLAKLDIRLGNVTRSNVILADIDKKLARKVNININEINLIWEELKLQNETLLNLNGSEMLPLVPQDEETGTRQSTQNIENFQMFSKPVDDGKSEKRRDVVESAFNNRIRDSKSKARFRYLP